MRTNRILLLSSCVVLLGAAWIFWPAAARTAAEDAPAGAKAPAATKPACCPDCEGEHAHEAGKDEDHDGHDHAEPAGKADEHDDHDAHDHAKPAGTAEGHDGHDDHDGHDHAEPAGKAEGHDEHDDHDGHDEDGHAGHDHGEAAVKMTAGQMKKFGIQTSRAAGGSLAKTIRLPGEIALNADRSAHVVPTSGGIVRTVLAKVGQEVQAGQELAWIESAELGEAKADFLAKFNEVNCCRMDLDRAKAIYENTKALLATLAKSPTLDDLAQLKPAEMGENRSKLISAYAEFVHGRQVLEREKRLVGERVSARSDYQAAQAAYKKAHATYLALRDSVAYATYRDFLEAQRSRRNSELALKAAERKLYVLGLTEKNVKALRTAAMVATAKECTDPNCESCRKAKALAAKEEVLGEKLAWYAMRAPFAGVITSKHIELGEKVSDESDAFTVADVSTVWVDLSVYQKDLQQVRKGQKVTIRVGSGVPDASGAIAFVSPVVDRHTRTCLARVVLKNIGGKYRPGLFVTADVAVGGAAVGVLVPKDAVQRIDNEHVVFVPAKGGLASRPVTLGRSNRTHVELVSGLKPGQEFVATGAFQLKAKLVTSGLGAHAGHGH